MAAKGIELIFLLICTQAIYGSHHACLTVSAKQINMSRLDCIKGSLLFWGGFISVFSENGLLVALTPLRQARGAATLQSTTLHFKEN